MAKGTALLRIDIFKLADSMDFENPYRLGYPKKDYREGIDADVSYTMVKVSFMNLVDEAQISIWRTAVWSRPSSSYTMHCGWEFDSVEKGPALTVFCALMEIPAISIKDLKALGLKNIKDLMVEAKRNSNHQGLQYTGPKQFP